MRIGLYCGCTRFECTTERRRYKARTSKYLLTKPVLNPRLAFRAPNVTLASSLAPLRATDADTNAERTARSLVRVSYSYTQCMFPSAEEGWTRAFLPQCHSGFASAIFEYLSLLSADTRKRRDVVITYALRNVRNHPLNPRRYLLYSSRIPMPSDRQDALHSNYPFRPFLSQFPSNLKKTTPVTPGFHSSQEFTKPSKYGVGAVDLWRHPEI